MIVIPRSLVRRFRALAKKCRCGRAHGPAPPVVCSAMAGTLTLWTRTTDAELLVIMPVMSGDGRMALPMSVLSAIERSSDDTVELEVDSRLRGVARWTDRGVKQVLPFDAVPLDGTHTMPLVSQEWHPLPATFLAALHECGRTTEPDPARYALNRVQLRGSTGQVIGSDGKAALLCQGFAFPFPDDVLVPALPVFGMRELTAAPDVRIGRTAKHLTVAAGAWCVRLLIDRTGRFPDITGVLPKSASTVIAIEECQGALKPSQ